MSRKLIYISCIVFIISSCKREDNIIPNNNAPYYGEIPTLLLENYVNRCYIDLLGREPLDDEMIEDVQFLRDNEVTIDSRDQLLYKLQFDTTFIEGDSSYNQAYFHRFYELVKVRLIEGAANSYINSENANWLFEYEKDSIAGNMINAYKRLLEYNKLNDILKSEKQYRNGVISVSEYHRRMVYNSIYDDINMNTFNYINAIFDNLLFRYPTSYEFNECKLMIDDNSTQILMGSSGNCKYDVASIICNSDEFYEGLVNWSFITFLGREANVQERDELMNNLIMYNDYQRIQRIILCSDEYAHFD
ncbi:MAG: hypothetical protein CMD02_01325 [Flavobacteriales bacterium]|nr:hypothetical protein [Flavobacteriales bacterium]|tara:strand:- start:269 stop:1180 length:912 start_codon:yes stop_codon:yes gene_type:complete